MDESYGDVFGADTTVRWQSAALDEPIRTHEQSFTSIVLMALQACAVEPTSHTPMPHSDVIATALLPAGADEFAYFSAAALRNWAGAAHWTTKTAKAAPVTGNAPDVPSRKSHHKVNLHWP